MATFRMGPFGVHVDLSDTEVNIISGSMNSSANMAALLAAALVGFGVTAPAATVSAIATAVLGLGAAALGTCNASSRGVTVTVLWVGLPWCKSR